MTEVFTTKGLIERANLHVRDVVIETDEVRVVATEWFLEGEMVRRDVFVNALRPISMGERLQ